jgi:hypothetical protein
VLYVKVRKWFILSDETYLLSYTQSEWLTVSVSHFTHTSVKWLRVNQKVLKPTNFNFLSHLSNATTKFYRLLLCRLYNITTYRQV